MTPEESHHHIRQTGHRRIDISVAASAPTVSTTSLFVPNAHGHSMDHMSEANARQVPAHPSAAARDPQRSGPAEEKHVSLIAPVLPRSAGLLFRRDRGFRRRRVADLAATGVTGDAHVEIDALMRYREQLMHSLEIPVSPPADGVTLLADFDKEYVRRYGDGGTVLSGASAGKSTSARLFQAVEVFALRARVSVPAGIPLARPERSASAEPALTDVYWPGHGRTGTDVYRGAPANMITGPALVELAHTTVAVPHGATLTAGPLGELRLKEF